MMQNNEFTSPESRFFYPIDYPVEHHDSVDTAGLPASEEVAGKTHYVVVDE